MVSPRVGATQLHKLCKYALELEQSGGGRGGVEADGVRGSQRWAEKGKGGCTMTASCDEFGDIPGQPWPPVVLRHQFQHFPSSGVSCDCSSMVCMHQAMMELRVVWDMCPTSIQ